MTGLPTVSVAVASYNYGRYLGDCLRSALVQEGVELEVIVVDDGSTDDSVDVARAIAAQDPRVRVTAHGRNHGHISTFNEALWSARGEFVVKLDSDDMLTPGALARGAAALRANPQVGFVYGNPLTFRDVPPPASSRITGVTVWPGAAWLATRCRRGTNVIMQPEAMMRTAVLRRTDGHRAHLPATHDLNLWLRMATLADVARIRGADQGLYRVHDDSLLRSVFGTYLADLTQRRAAFEDFYDTWGTDPARIARLRRASRRALARQALRYARRQHDRGSGQDLAPYLDFATETDPTIGGSRRAESLRGRTRSPSSGELRRRWAALSEAARNVEDSVTWRRWRRYGT